MKMITRFANVPHRWAKRKIDVSQAMNKFSSVHMNILKMIHNGMQVQDDIHKALQWVTQFHQHVKEQCAACQSVIDPDILEQCDDTTTTASFGCLLKQMQTVVRHTAKKVFNHNPESILHEMLATLRDLCEHWIKNVPHDTINHNDGDPVAVNVEPKDNPSRKRSRSHDEDDRYAFTIDDELSDQPPVVQHEMDPFLGFKK